MKGVVIQRSLVAALLMIGVLGTLLVLPPFSAKAGHASSSEEWINQLTGFVVVQRGIAQANGEGGSFDPYADQLTSVRRSFEQGDRKGTYVAMNRLMDMLEARAGGISNRAADAIWDYCYQVTPPALHDVKRHKQWWDKTVDWQKFFWEE